MGYIVCWRSKGKPFDPYRPLHGLGVKGFFTLADAIEFFYDKKTAPKCVEASIYSDGHKVKEWKR